MPGRNNIHCQVVINGIRHLGSCKPVPDQTIKIILIAVQVILQHVRRKGDIRRPDRLMGILRATAGLECPRFSVIVIIPIVLSDIVSGS